MGWADNLRVVAPNRVAQNYILFLIAFCFTTIYMGAIDIVPAIT
jgi:hypothetical protein